MQLTVSSQVSVLKATHTGDSQIPTDPSSLLNSSTSHHHHHHRQDQDQHLLKQKVQVSPSLRNLQSYIVPLRPHQKDTPLLCSDSPPRPAAEIHPNPTATSPPGLSSTLKTACGVSHSGSRPNKEAIQNLKN